MVISRLDNSLPPELLSFGGVGGFLEPTDFGNYRLASRRINYSLGGRNSMMESVIRHHLGVPPTPILIRFLHAKCEQGADAVSLFLNRISEVGYLALRQAGQLRGEPFKTLASYNKFLRVHHSSIDTSDAPITDVLFRSLLKYPITALHIRNASKLTQASYDLLNDSNITTLSLGNIVGSISLKSTKLTYLRLYYCQLETIDLTHLPNLKELVLERCGDLWVLNAADIEEAQNKILEKLIIRGSHFCPRSEQLNFRIIELCIESHIQTSNRIEFFIEGQTNFLLENITIKDCKGGVGFRFHVNHPSFKGLRLINSSLTLEDFFNCPSLENLELSNLALLFGHLNQEFVFPNLKVLCANKYSSSSTHASQIINNLLYTHASQFIDNLLKSPVLEEVVINNLSEREINLSPKKAEIISSHLRKVHVNGFGRWENLDIFGGEQIQEISISNGFNLHTLTVGECNPSCTIKLAYLLNLKEFQIGNWKRPHRIESLSITGTALHTLSIGHCHLEKLCLFQLPDLIELVLPSSLRHLSAKQCPNIREFQRLSTCTDLESLQLEDLASETKIECGEHQRLERLILRNSFPTTGNFTSLKKLRMEGSQNIPTYFQNIEAFNALERLVVKCSNLDALVLGHYPHLTHLSIRSMENASKISALNLTPYTHLERLELIAVVADQLSLENSSVSTLRIAGGSIAQLDVSALTALKHLQIAFMVSLTTCKLGNAALESLTITNAANLSLVNFSNLTHLGTLHLRDCNLKGFSLNLPSVTHLILEDCTGMPELDLSGLPNALVVEVRGCSGLQSIRQAEDVTNFKLRELDLDGLTKLKVLTLAQYPHLSQVRVLGKPLQQLELRNLPFLTDVLIPGSEELVSVYLDNLPQLSEVRLMNGITHATLTVQNCPAFTFDRIEREKSYSTISLSGEFSCGQLELKDHPLRVLSVSVPSLCDLVVKGDQLEQLLLDCPALEYAEIKGDLLQQIDMSHSPILHYLYLRGEHLRECVLNADALLQSLFLQTPVLSPTHFSNLSDLRTLFLSRSSIIELPAGCLELSSLKIEDSALEILDLSHFGKLGTVEVRRCPSLSRIIHAEDVSTSSLREFIAEDVAIDLNLSNYPLLSRVEVHGGHGEVSLTRLPALVSVAFSKNANLTRVHLVENEQLVEVTTDSLSELSVVNCPSLALYRLGSNCRVLRLSGPQNNRILSIYGILLQELHLDNTNHIEVLFDNARALRSLRVVRARNMPELRKLALEHLPALTTVVITNCPQLAPPVATSSLIQHVETDTRWRTFLLRHPRLSMHVKAGIVPVVQEVTRTIFLSGALSWAIALPVRSILVMTTRVFVMTIAVAVVGVVLLWQRYAKSRFQEVYNRYKTAIDNDVAMRSLWQEFLIHHPRIHRHKNACAGVLAQYGRDLAEIVAIFGLVFMLGHGFRLAAATKGISFTKADINSALVTGIISSTGVIFLHLEPIYRQIFAQPLPIIQPT